MKILSILIIFFSCSIFQRPPSIDERKPFLEQRLLVRPTHQGLITNQICKQRKNNECVKWDAKVYDLKDAAFRKLVNDLKISCLIGKQRWRICLDRPGYCRREKKCVKFKNVWWDFKDKLRCVKEKLVESYIPAFEKHEYLVESYTRCYSMFQ